MRSPRRSLSTSAQLPSSLRVPRWLGFVAYGLVIGASALGGCNVTVYDDDDGTCDADCDPPPNEEGCPAQEPSVGDACSPDSLTCSYSHEPNEECTYVLRCDPVYPEAGAPSEWVLTDTLGGGCEQCLEAPACEDYEEQVESCEGIGVELDCHSVTACGSTVFCVAPTCDLAPTCDPGDAPAQGSCPPDLCYVAEACGSTLECVDTALPQHGCPFAEPELGTACTVDDICSYPDGPDCFVSYGCTSDGVWEGYGGECVEGG